MEGGSGESDLFLSRRRLNPSVTGDSGVYTSGQDKSDVGDLPSAGVAGFSYESPVDGRISAVKAVIVISDTPLRC